MKTETRQNTLKNRSGRTVTIVCPFCETEVLAYSWSLAGSGKKCPKCDAKHTLLHGTIKKL